MAKMLIYINHVLQLIRQRKKFTKNITNRVEHYMTYPKLMINYNTFALVRVIVSIQ